MTLEQLSKSAFKCFQENNFPKALSYVNEALALDPNHPDSLCLQGIIDFKENRLQAAKTCFNRVLDLAAGHDLGRRYLAQVDQRIKEIFYLAEFVHNKENYMDFPRFVAIETVGRCNANCNFCPHESLDRKNTEMGDDLFDKIISDLEIIPAHVPLRIIPNHVNEPFMDRKIFSRLMTINERLPQATFSIFTNLNVIHRNFFSDLKQIKNIQSFNISFNAANQQEYESTMKIDFNRTVDNLKMLMSKNKIEQFLASPIILSRVSSLTDSDGRYKEECVKIFKDFSLGKDFDVRVKNRTNWLGNLSSPQSNVPKEMPCNAWFDLNIFCSGVVPHCCMDGTGEYSIGDVRKSSVLEIYNDIKFRFMRERLATREETHPCNNCSLLQ